MYIVSTDGLGHAGGPGALAKFLRAMDARLHQFRREHPQLQFHTVLFSDHGLAGGPPLVNIWPRVEAAVEAGGFRLRESAPGEREAVVLSFGLLSSFAAYTFPGEERELASLIAGVAGVDLCVTPAEGGWGLVSSRGEADIAAAEVEGEQLWSYLPRYGDPLDYAPVVAALRRRAGEPARNRFADQWWFEATREHRYPDALYRVAHAFRLAANPASLLCSVADGHMFGARMTEYAAAPTIGRLRWTHGALHRDASLGFLMSDVPGWEAPAAVRFNRALEFLAKLGAGGGRRVSER